MIILVIKELQFKTTRRCYLTSTQLTIIQKTGVGKEVEGFEPLDGAGNYVKWADTWGNSLT